MAMQRTKRRTVLILVLFILLGSVGCMPEDITTEKANILPLPIKNTDEATHDLNSPLTDTPAGTPASKMSTAPKATSKQSSSSTSTTSTTSTTTTSTTKETTSTTTSKITTTIATIKPEDNDFTVYITKTGTKYHLDGCRHLSKSKIPISRAKAIKQGYTPCAHCDPGP